MAANGSYRNPVERPCWEVCQACGRCEQFGSRDICGTLCSGRWDPYGKIDPDRRDFCDCRNGILRWKTQQGQQILVPYRVNPYKGSVQQQKMTEDERDWNSYVNDMREKMDDPDWDPIVVEE